MYLSRQDYYYGDIRPAIELHKIPSPYYFRFILTVAIAVHISVAVKHALLF